MTTDLVLDTIEMALWVRGHSGSAIEKGLIHHSDRGSQGGFNRSSQPWPGPTPQRISDQGPSADGGLGGRRQDRRIRRRPTEAVYAGGNTGADLGGTVISSRLCDESSSFHHTEQDLPVLVTVLEQE